MMDQMETLQNDESNAKFIFPWHWTSSFLAFLPACQHLSATPGPSVEGDLQWEASTIFDTSGKNNYIVPIAINLDKDISLSYPA